MNEKLKLFIGWILDRLSENSTWRGILLTATAAGIYLKPDQAASITATGLAVVGLINVFRQGSPTKAQVAEALETKADKT